MSFKPIFVTELVIFVIHINHFKRSLSDDFIVSLHALLVLLSLSVKQCCTIPAG